jgi:serine/threonine protein kinase
VDAEHCSVDGEKLGGPQVVKGKKIERYVFDDLLGLGGTGCVYKGRTEDGQACAIKLLFREMAGDESLVQRFRREAEAVSQIHHPNVVKIFGHGTTPAGTVFIAMEHLEGKTLKDILEADAPLSHSRAGRMAEQIASGLGEAHRLGFVHRDLKPGNIMICRDRMGREQVKLLDFGIVASIRERDSDQRLTKTGYIVGTPTYMAPEQIDPKAVGPQVDVYAIGVMLYEMLCGQPPFRGTLEQILVAKMTEDPTPIEHSGELGELALRFLEKDPEKRPQNALQASAQLGRLALLSDDPATVRAEIPDLPSYAEVGPAPNTLKFEDSSSDPSWTTDRTKPSTTLRDDWSADTRRINFEWPGSLEHTRPPIGSAPADEVVAPYRPDTLIDGVPAGMSEGHTVPPVSASAPAVITQPRGESDLDMPTQISASPIGSLDRDTDEDMEKQKPSVSEPLGGRITLDLTERDSNKPTEQTQPADANGEDLVEDARTEDTFDRFRREEPSYTGEEATDLQFVYDPALRPPPAPVTRPSEPRSVMSVRLLALGVIVFSLFVMAAVLAFDYFTTETVIIDVPHP